jgi:8-oxo-dGTP pyrophosphatase MutT (NUDIX family)
MPDNFYKIISMELSRLVGYLQKKLIEPLPGKKAHFEMIPSTRLREFYPIPETARKSSVLLLLFEKQETIYTLLILRPAYNGVHSAQVSFPGGSYSDEDLTPENTALRELEEETGISRTQIKIIGSLSELYIPPSNFVVKPFVGFTNESFNLTPDSVEVEEIYQVELKELIGNKNIKTKTIRIQSGAEFITPFYDVCGLTVWGATAMMLREFSEICRDFYLL